MVLAALSIALPVDASERSAAYQQFRDHFDARHFAEALPAAEQVVMLTEQQFGPGSKELVKPLLNLATTQKRLKNFTAAEGAYKRALVIVEQTDGGNSRGVIEPLHGLGTTYFEAGQYTTAAETLRRAVDVSRKLDGLFNVQQLPLVEALIDTYVALDQVADVDREQQYALRLSENAYGRNDPRMLPVLARSAEWCETTGRYRMARQAHARQLDIIGRTAGKRDPAVVAPLRGIARSYLNEYLYGTQEADATGREYNPAMTGTLGGMQSPSSDPTRIVRLDVDGEDALKLALAVLEDRPDQVALRAETLLDLGDWYQIGGDNQDAKRTYRDAWAAFSAPGAPGTALMSAPTQLYYKAPASSVRRPDQDADEVEEHFVEVVFTVTPEGRVTDTRVLSTDASDAQERSVTTALRRARYRPRFVDGNPVATTDVRHRQVMYASVSPARDTNS
jgi:tetratricopeptide (TPR) repeat protein